MREPWNWVEQDLLDLVAGKVQESVTLDYKASDSLGKSDGKKREISKDVSALANSAGGTIVYGIYEDPNARHYPGGIDNGCDPAEISKEWLEQVINSSIQRRIDGVRVNPIDLSLTNPGYVAYAVYVPQSLRAPHQAADKRFYKRFNFESVPMEEYEIRDVALRRSGPDLHVLYTLDEARVDMGKTVAMINASVTNRSPNVAEYTIVDLLFGLDLSTGLSTRLTLETGPNIRANDGTSERTIPTWQHSVTLAIPNHLPLFEGVSFNLLDTPLALEIPRGIVSMPSIHALGWRIRSPGMPETFGFQRLRRELDTYLLRDKVTLEDYTISSDDLARDPGFSFY